MSSFNKVILVGNLTRDPELRFIPSGAAVATLGLAVNNPRADNETLFVDVTVWNKVAENCSKFLSKGSPVLVEGRLIYRTWDDKNTGQKRGKHEIVAETVQFLRGGSGGGRGEGGSSQQDGYSDFDQSYEPPSQGKGRQAMPPVDMPDDDIPF
ncbi:single-stranded DNA-binding protein [Desulfurispirillum indicum]|uniref:Single-stranded DNA-binding protein n=1 Tax=Desulfurispirillum indicum (strain ATCC BAA-1389 / DSM 22839 / S5) TaxID=653733 RepID=E6W1E1_DESIS|nr:single-stranded DNA-binding protein [Desulfurispirillum indicum]ADU65397.1 single-strand binding protein [Desulfurispirillum indicum S5]UCZ57291.1 single-stranded DNA-binding protein [Desulfurispirillum indicum]